MINRGGEKIWPVEIESVLLAHPAIAQAVSFSIPDVRLGEEVGAAVVLRPGASVGKADILDFAAARLADFKLPRHLVIVADIPKGPTGKLQRVGLAQTLGLVSDVVPRRGAQRVPPRNEVERRLVAIGATSSSTTLSAFTITFWTWAATLCWQRWLSHASATSSASTCCCAKCSSRTCGATRNRGRATD